MTVTQELEDLLLVVEEDHTVHYALGRQSGRWDAGPDDLCDQAWLGDVPCVRLLGAPAAYGLARCLDRRRFREGAPRRVALASPSLCRRGTGPADVLGQMSEICLPGSVGGWHDFGPADRAAADLVEASCDPGPWMTGLREAFARHPLHRALTFLPTLDWLRAVQVLVAWGDPRWHVDPRHPDRSARLREYLGVGDRGGVETARLCWEELSGSRRSPSAADWAAFARAPALQAWTAGLLDGSERSSPHDPRNFLVRAFSALRLAKGPPTALLRTTHLFLRYLRLAWLAALGGHAELSATEHFFRIPAEARAWRMWQAGEWESDEPRSDR